MPWRFALLLLAGSLLAGCSLGPAKLPATRMDYNLAVQRSSNEEMLLNIVRMKYFEQPLFLQVGSIASSFSYNVGGTASATYPDQRDFLRGIYGTYTPSITGQYTDAPTVTYTPYQGQTYSQQFLAELDFDRFVVLYRSGWDIEYLMRILVERIGKLDHSFDARVGFDADHHRDFLELTKIIADMDDNGLLDIVTASGGKDKPNITVMGMSFKDKAEADRVQQLLGTDLKVQTAANGRLTAKVRLVPVRDVALGLDTTTEHNLPSLALRLRNCLRAMDVVAQGTSVPPELLGRKAAYDLRAQAKDVMDIRVSSLPPSDAYVSVRHGRWWYSIANDDNRSKEVLQLVLNLFALQSADPPKNSPVLTLPVGAN